MPQSSQIDETVERIRHMAPVRKESRKFSCQMGESKGEEVDPAGAKYRSRRGRVGKRRDKSDESAKKESE
jgi:hypothetical protein